MAARKKIANLAILYTKEYLMGKFANAQKVSSIKTFSLFFIIGKKIF
jgi:hypothetical protein